MENECVTPATTHSKPPTGIDIREALLRAVEGALREHIVFTDVSSVQVLRWTGKIRVNCYPSRGPFQVNVDLEFRAANGDLSRLASPVEHQIIVEGSFARDSDYHQPDPADAIFALLTPIREQLSRDDSFVEAIVYPNARWSINLRLCLQLSSSVRGHTPGAGFLLAPARSLKQPEHPEPKKRGWYLDFSGPRGPQRVRYPDAKTGRREGSISPETFNLVRSKILVALRAAGGVMKRSVLQRKLWRYWAQEFNAALSSLQGSRAITIEKTMVRLLDE